MAGCTLTEAVSYYLLQRGRTRVSADGVASLSLQDQAFQPHLASGWQEMTLAIEAT
jgi:hypothetical protein